MARLGDNGGGDEPEPVVVVTETADGWAVTSTGDEPVRVEFSGQGEIVLTSDRRSIRVIVGPDDDDNSKPLDVSLG